MAKFYIYRNLHLKDTFSIRHRGIVIDRSTHFIATGVEFKVNEAGRAAVLRERRKNVHAFVVCSAYQPTQLGSLGLTRVRYNPYEGNTFTVDGAPIHRAKSVLFVNGQCWLMHESDPNLRTEHRRP